MQLPAPMEVELTTSELISGFYQRGSGNCASIAAIKASLAAFGTKPVFQHTEAEDDRYHVVMRDSSTVYTFTETELRQASGSASFQGEHKKLLDHAQFMYASMAKRAQIENNDGYAGDSYERALASLDDGEYWKEGPHWLGLSSIVVQGPDSPVFLWQRRSLNKFLRNKIAGIAKSPKHTWFVSYGTHDVYGKAEKAPWTMSGAIGLDPELAKDL